MKKIIIAVAAALFAFAVQAANDPAAPAAKQMSAEECKSAMDACGNDAQCKEKLKEQNGCK